MSTPRNRSGSDPPSSGSGTRANHRASAAWERLTDQSAWAAAESLPDAPGWLLRLQALVAYWDDRLGRLRLVAVLTVVGCVMSELVCLLFVLATAGPRAFLQWQNIVIPITTASIMTPLILLPILRILAYTRELGERYRLLAQHDPLTGALNRHGLFDSEQRPQLGELIVVADIDQFKMVNDVHGHSIGDQVLIAVFDKLRVHFGPEARICRSGGDEFMVVTGPSATVPDALTVRLRNVTVRVSLGSMVMRESGVAGLDGARAVADQVMYRAKRSTPRGPISLGP